MEDQNIFLDLLMGVKNNVSSPEACTRDAGVQLPNARASGGAQVPVRGCIRRSRHRCSWLPSAQTSHRFHSMGVPHSDCHGVWNAGGPQTSVPE